MRLLEGLGCDIWGDLDATFGGTWMRHLGESIRPDDVDKERG